MAALKVDLRPIETVLFAHTDADGAYSARPELSDLIDLSVLVDVPVAVRHERLSTQEERTWLNAWHARWDGAEEYYFTHVLPASSFDLVITNAHSRK